MKVLLLLFATVYSATVSTFNVGYTNLAFECLAVADGFLYFGHSNTIVKVDLSTNTSNVVAGNTLTGQTIGQGTDARLVSPRGLAFGKTNLTNTTLYFATQAFLRQMNSTYYVSDFAGETISNTLLSGELDGNMTSGRLGAAQYVAVSLDGSKFYVSDSDNAKIRVANPSNNSITTFFDGNIASVFTNMSPGGVAIDSDGSTSGYVGNYLFVCGGIHGLADGVGALAKFADPEGIAFDSWGNLIVNDGNRIRMITPNGNVSTIAGNGTRRGIDGDALTVAAFNSLGAIAIHPVSGAIYVVDLLAGIRILSSDYYTYCFNYSSPSSSSSSVSSIQSTPAASSSAMSSSVSSSSVMSSSVSSSSAMSSSAASSSAMSSSAASSSAMSSSSVCSSSAMTSSSAASSSSATAASFSTVSGSSSSTSVSTSTSSGSLSLDVAQFLSFGVVLMSLIASFGIMNSI